MQTTPTKTTEAKSGARPDGTRVLFVNAPGPLLDALDARVEALNEENPLARKISRSDLVLGILADAAKSWPKADPT